MASTTEFLNNVLANFGIMVNDSVGIWILMFAFFLSVIVFGLVAGALLYGIKKVLK